MLSFFFPLEQLEAYRESPYKNRIDLIGQQLIEQRYRPAVTSMHVREWLLFARYLQRTNAALPQDSRAVEAQAYLAHRLQRCSSASRVRFVRASIRIFLEADLRGRFAPRVVKPKRSLPHWLEPAVTQYLTFLQDQRGLAPRTVDKRVRELTQFAESLEQAGIKSLSVIAPLHIQRFLIELRGLAPMTRMSYATTLRSFLRWTYIAGLLSVDIRRAVTSPRRFKQRGIREVLTESELARILSSVDRTSVTGRRDYAVLILAARYGLRPSDIRLLRLDNLQWREGIISLRQAKTGRPLTLPLLSDVADALVAYLRDGRPPTASRHVFVRHLAPFEPFVATNNLAPIMQRALHRAGLDQRQGLRGLYLFRHTLASRMLAAGSPVKSIGDVLGHATTETTMEYASIDLRALRCVAISEAEVRP